MRLVLTKLQPLRARIFAGRSAILNGRTFLIRDLEDVNYILACLDEAIEKRIPPHSESAEHKRELDEPVTEVPNPAIIPESVQRVPIKTRRRAPRKG